jgi:hypothetical protein
VEGDSSSDTRWPLEGDEVWAESRSQDDSAENKGVLLPDQVNFEIIL